MSDGFCCDISLLPSEYGLFCKVIIVQSRAVIFGEFINIHAFTSEPGFRITDHELRNIKCCP